MNSSNTNSVVLSPADLALINILVLVSKHCFQACRDSCLPLKAYKHIFTLPSSVPRQLDWVMLVFMVCYVLLVAWLLILPPRYICCSISICVCWLSILRFSSLYPHHLAQTRSVTLSVSTAALWSFFMTQKSKRRLRNSYLGGTSECFLKCYCNNVTWHVHCDLAKYFPIIPMGTRLCHLLG